MISHLCCRMAVIRSGFFIILLVLGTLAGKFTDLSYTSVTSTIDSLKGDFVLISTAQSLYGHPLVMQESMSCSPYIVSVSDLPSLHSDVSRPQVLISGEIHGDERVGPAVSVALAQLLAWGAKCAIHNDHKACATLDHMHVSTAQMTWLAFLSTRRETIIVPTANCMGYMKGVRSDGGVDPNRDYPYSRKDGRCMLSASAKLFQRLMETNLVQTVVTFHGGMVALGYEWGSRNHLRPKDASPDEKAHRSIAELMRDLAGSFKNEAAYPVGPINTLIYPVEGGMEDWLYAAGWDRGPLRECTGTGSAGQPRRPRDRRKLITTTPSQLRHGRNETDSGGAKRYLAEPVGENRAVVFLVETSDRKKPLDSTLGGTLKILDPNGEQNGHVPRNVRLSLAAIDMVQPYTCLSQVSLINKQRRAVVPRRALRDRNARQLTAPPPLNATESAPTADLQVEWYVGGSQTVDCTFLAWHTAPTPVLQKNSHSNWSKYLATLDSAAMRGAFDATCHHSGETSVENNLRREGQGAPAKASFPVVASLTFNGTSRWAKGATASSSLEEEVPTSRTSSVGATISYAGDDPMRPLSTYRATIAPRHANRAPFAPGRYWLVAWSLVDQHYGVVGQGFPAEMAPQSHLSNVRTNPAWRKTAGHRAIQGRLYWPSDPVEVVVHANGTYHMASVVAHCAWWDRQLVVEHDVQAIRDPTGSGDSALSTDPASTTTASWFDFRNNTIAQNVISNIFDRANYVPTGEQSGSAYKIFGITLGLLLITVVCCVVLYYQYRRSSIYAQVANNKAYGHTKFATA